MEPASLLFVTHCGIDFTDSLKIKGAVGRVLLGHGQVQFQNRRAPFIQIKADIGKFSLDQGVNTGMAALALIHDFNIEITGLFKVFKGLV
jgi:hypothetical protein